MDSTLIIFLLVFLGQIGLISIWYPLRFAARVKWIAED